MSDQESQPEDMFDCNDPAFEAHCRINGMDSWSSREFARFIGYKDYKAFFTGPLNKAQSVCLTSKINLADHFKQETCIEDGKPVEDIRLSRFACYLCAMNGDIKKPEVARAQAYFASLADACQNYIEHAEQLDRLLVRDEITDGEKSLSSVATAAGVKNYSYFQNAGYRGMYNMNFAALKKLKGTPDGRSPLDFMGKSELAANLFRITQTTDKIKADGIRGQGNLEKTANEVGKTVRATMLKISGQRPEALPPDGDIRAIKKGLKETGKVFQKIGKKSAKKKPNDDA